jgi:hypothetical protein
MSTSADGGLPRAGDRLPRTSPYSSARSVDQVSGHRAPPAVGSSSAIPGLSSLRERGLCRPRFRGLDTSIATGHLERKRTGTDLSIRSDRIHKPSSPSGRGVPESGRNRCRAGIGPESVSVRLSPARPQGSGEIDPRGRPARGRPGRVPRPDDPGPGRTPAGIAGARGGRHPGPAGGRTGPGSRRSRPADPTGPDERHPWTGGADESRGRILDFRISIW